MKVLVVLVLAIAGESELRYNAFLLETLENETTISVNRYFQAKEQHFVLRTEHALHSSQHSQQANTHEE